MTLWHQLRKNEPRVRNQVVTPRDQDARQSPIRNESERSRADLQNRRVLSKTRRGSIAIVSVVLGYNAMAGSKLFLLHRVVVSDANLLARRNRTSGPPHRRANRLDRVDFRR